MKLTCRSNLKKNGQSVEIKLEGITKFGYDKVSRFDWIGIPLNLPSLLIHSFPVRSFSTHWKHQKTVRFSDVFKGYIAKVCIGNEWIKRAIEEPQKELSRFVIQHAALLFGAKKHLMLLFNHALNNIKICLYQQYKKPSSFNLLSIILISNWKPVKFHS